MIISDLNDSQVFFYKFLKVSEISKVEEITIREKIGAFMQMNPNIDTKQIVDHFLLENISKRTIYGIIKGIRNGNGINRMTGTGKYQQSDQKMKNKIIEFSVLGGSKKCPSGL